MPICTYKQPFDRVRGTFRDFAGGVVAIGSNKNGNVLRQWLKPTDTYSPAKAGVRAAFGLAATAFKALSSAEASDWNDAASDFKRQNSIGIEHVFSGINLYVAVNSIRQIAGFATTDAVPTHLLLPQFDGANATIEVPGTPPVPPTGEQLTTIPFVEAPPTGVSFGCLASYTGPWTLPARQPRRNDYRMRDQTNLANNVFMVPAPGTSISCTAANPDIVFAVGDVVHVRALGLTQDYVPALTPVTFAVTVTAS